MFYFKGLMEHDSALFLFKSIKRQKKSIVFYITNKWN